MLELSRFGTCSSCNGGLHSVTVREVFVILEHSEEITTTLWKCLMVRILSELCIFS